MDGVTELTQADKLKARRQARSQKILQGGTDRLNKITNIQRGASEATPLATSRSSSPCLRTEDNPTSIDSDGPIGDLQQSSFHISTPAEMTSPLNNTSIPTQVQMDPSQTMVDPEIFLNALRNANVNVPPGDSRSDMPNLNGLPPLLVNLLSSMTTPEAPSEPVAPDTSFTWWNLLHLVSMTLVYLYALYLERLKEGSFTFSERWAALETSRPENTAAVWEMSGMYANKHGSHIIGHIPLLYYFMTVELALQTIRGFLQRRKTIPPSLLSSIASHCSPPISTIVYSIARYSPLLTSAINDLATLFFFLGLTIIISSFFG